MVDRRRSDRGENERSAWDTCEYRREKQMAYNKAHGIVPRSVSRPVQESLRSEKDDRNEDLLVAENSSPQEIKKLVHQLEKEMLEAVKKLEFEKAALLRDQINFLKDGSTPRTSKTGQSKKYRKRRKTSGPK